MMITSISLRTALELCGISKDDFVELWTLSQDMQYVSVKDLYTKGILNARVYSIKPRFETLGGSEFVCMSFKIDKHSMMTVKGL